MKSIRSALLYTAMALLANAAHAQEAPDLEARPNLEALKDGDMRKLAIASNPAPAPEATFTTEDGAEASLADYAGKPVVLNFWATWCAPCREEMPHLSALQDAMGADAVVLTVATGRNPPEAIDRFFEEIGVDNLPKALDPRQEMARAFGVLGLPVTVLIDAEGREVARLQGDADWSSDSAQAIVAALAAD
ncbi:Thiol-disulfide isomerase or thioredoxin [Loktanella fryxellensis]|uniref:Thiol-disulfide isomerase or thioredoxin n=1 Tax=Loktanella fryxellensis TaxID=245187 RepID=A0A1H8AZX6_9RHOB|nr:TlpA disulfide reductase family protein [Loktanella fryxellensis]SEM76275.1 Thiol-disulfide isomerase or thioredoxin [Loktanella fryxellensis]